MGKIRRRRQRLPAEPIPVNIERLSHEGRGVGHIDGKIAFVSGALPGETVMARYTSRRSQFDELKVESVLEASADRVEPPCEVASMCGGCLMQHCAVPAQLQMKQQVLFDHLEHSAGIKEFTVLPAMSSQSLHYRRKARLAVRYVHKRSEVLVGFREKGNTFITDMHDCHVLVKPVARLIDPLRELIHSMDACRDIPQIEVAVGETHPVASKDFDQALQVALILRHLQALSSGDLQRLRDFADAHGIEWYLQPAGPQSVTRFWPEGDQETLRYFLPETNGQDIEIQFGPSDFTQVNAAINRLMIQQALGLLELQPEDRVLDLFCGLGNFTLPVARRCAHVTGVEGSGDMVRRASGNAQHNGINNAAFYAADLFSEFDTSSWAKSTYNKLLLDPPRSGAIEISSRIRELLPETIVYVSCNPATLARDAAELQKQGYTLTHAGIMDMFPHTGHVESMAKFTLNERY